MGKIKLEMHFHTKESSPCGKILAKNGVKLYQKAGCDGIVVTDHFSKSVYGGPEEGDWEEICKRFLKGYHQAKQFVINSEFTVLLGMEIRFPDNDNDFLVYGINEKFLIQHPWLYMKGLENLYHVAKENNLLIVQAHPYRDNCFLAPVDLLHGIEVFNGNPRHNSRNELAEKAANEHGLLQTIGSDFHQEGDILDRFFELDDLPKNGQELVSALRNK